MLAEIAQLKVAVKLALPLQHGNQPSVANFCQIIDQLGLGSRITPGDDAC
jgi:hypothetical protein